MLNCALAASQGMLPLMARQFPSPNPSPASPPQGVLGPHSTWQACLREGLPPAPPNLAAYSIKDRLQARWREVSPGVMSWSSQPQWGRLRAPTTHCRTDQGPTLHCFQLLADQLLLPSPPTLTLLCVHFILC